MRAPPLGKMFNFTFSYYACSGNKQITCSTVVIESIWRKYNFENIDLQKKKEEVSTRISYEKLPRGRLLRGSLVEPGNNVGHEFQLAHKIFKKSFSHPSKNFCIRPCK